MAMTPTDRRGYPLPPWAVEPLAGVDPTGADVLEWLLHLVNDGNGRQAEAYLADQRARLSHAQGTASRCALEDHQGLTTELRDARVAVRDAYDAGHADGIELAAARQYVDGHLPADLVDLLDRVDAGVVNVDDAVNLLGLPGATTYSEDLLGRLELLPLEPAVAPTTALGLPVDRADVDTDDAAGCGRGCPCA